MRFMGEGAAYAVVAMQQAVADSGLTEAEISHPRTGLIAGSGGPSTANMLTAFDTTREKGPKRVGPYICLLFTSPSPRDQRGSRMPSSA